MAGEALVESGREETMTNGDDSGSSSTAMKRKHENESLSIAAAPAPTGTQQQDILEVLKSHNNTEPFLEHEFSEQSSEPSSKRTKLSASNNRPSSIAQKLENARYSEWAQIIADIESVKEKIIHSVRDQDATTDDRPSMAVLKQIQQATAVADVIMSIVTNEAVAHAQSDSVVFKQELEETAGGDVEKAMQEEATATVLTLFGNAPTPKQLFSSLQVHRAANRRPSVVKNELRIEELSLPNGLSATKIKASDPLATQKAPTFADSFPAPSALPLLTTPKSNRRSAPKDNILRWELKSAPSRGGKRGGYTTQKIPVADWLSYGANETRHDSLSPLEKRQQRERALSGSRSDVVLKTDTDALAEELDKEEEALFQQAYSSFAPSHDNSRSLVDASVKSMVWWNKVGDRRFNARFAGEYSLGASLPLREMLSAARSKTTTDDFARAVEEYDGEVEAEYPDEKVLDLTDVDTVLRRITDLLQTLASYQWIRSSVQPNGSAASRASISPAPSVSGTTTKPDMPSAEERETYEKLRHEIAYLVLQLPPYAVAKVDGDQLAELGISSLITFNAPNYRGQLEEDQVARIARYTAAATAASVASLTRSSVVNSPHYSSSSRTPAIGQSANTRYGQSTGYGPGRSSLPHSSAQQGAAGNYGTPTAPPRSQYTQPGQYARAGVPQTTSSFGQHDNAQYPGVKSYNPRINQGVSQMQAQPGTYQTLLQQRSQVAATNAVGYQAAHGQMYNDSASSPAKTGQVSNASNGQQFTQQVQPAGPGRATPVNHASPAQTPVDVLHQARAPHPPPPPLLQSPVSQSSTPQPAAPMQGHVVNGHA